MINCLFEKLHHYYWSKPKRLISHGMMVCNIAACWLAAGLYAKAGVLGVSVLSTAPQGSNAAQAFIGQLYPSMPTWWIPEHSISFFLLIASFGLGAWMAIFGKKLDRLMHYV